MEAAGLGIGIAGLIGLFSTCLDIVGRIDSYKSFQVESEALFAQFEADRILFRRWGQDVGINQHTPDPTKQHAALRDPGVSEAVGRILNSIKEIDTGADNSAKASHSMGGLARRLTSSTATKWKLSPDNLAATPSRASRAGWAVRNKARYITMIQTFRSLVERLYDLVPPTGREKAQGAEPETIQPITIQISLKWPDEIQKLVLELQKQIEGEVRKELDSWIGTQWTNEIYDDRLQRRISGTCDWILDRPEFIEWNSHKPQADAASVLWINGHAGYGKTVLCARLVQFLSASSPDPVAYFFFSSELETRADPYVVARSWVSQFIAQNKRAITVAQDFWEAMDARSSNASKTDIFDLLARILSEVTNCTMIVDGIDECAGRDSLKMFLKSLKQVISPLCSKMLIVSRDETEIREALMSTGGDHDWRLTEYRISSTDVKQDAGKVSLQKMDEKLANKTEEQRKDLAERMVERCDSMFLSIEMLGKDIAKGKSFKRLQQIIDQAPIGLEDIYDRNWNEIKNLREPSRSRAFAILRWATFSLRPLTVLELTGALLFADEETDDPAEEDLPDAIDEDYIDSEIVELCGSLIQVRSAGSEAELSRSTIHLTHFSVREYVLCHMLTPGWGLILEEKLKASHQARQNEILALVCLRYLNNEELGADSSWDEEKIPFLKAFWEYAAGFWYQYAAIKDVNSESIDKMAIDLFNPENPAWGRWWKFFETWEQPSALKYQGDISNGSPLFYATLLKRQAMVEYLLDTVKIDVNDVDESGRTALLAACSKGWLLGVKSLLIRGADVSLGSNEKTTPLHAATDGGHIAAVQMILDANADIEAQNIYSMDSLQLAVDRGFLKIVQLLVDRGGNIDRVTPAGYRPLHSASYNGNIGIVQLLLNKGASQLPDELGATPLHCASEPGNKEIVEVLLANGADIDARKNEGLSSLDVASIFGKSETAGLLLKKGADQSGGLVHGTPLRNACVRGHTEVVRAFVDAGCDMNQINSDLTLLHEACIDGYTDIAKILLENGGDLAALAPEGYAPIYFASRLGHLEIVKMLIERGATQESHGEDGFNAVHCACMGGHIETVRFLVEHGGSIDDADGIPLRCAVCSGHLDLARYLIDQGASREPDSKGWTLMHYAASEGNLDIVRLLLDRGAPIAEDGNGFTPLHFAACAGHIDTVKYLIDQGASSDADGHGLTLLHGASSGGHLDLARYLLDQGARMEREKEGNTPLHYESFEGQLDMIKLLLDRGASMDANEGGWTPLYCAASHGHLDTIKYLLNQGASMDADNNGWTPLHAAAYEGRYEVVNYLLDERKILLGEEGPDAWTPLHSAAAAGQEDIVRLLMDRGASFHADSRGETPLYVATICGHLEICTLLIEHDSRKSTSEGGQFILQQGADIRHRERFGRNVIFASACNGSKEIFQFLLSVDDTEIDAADIWGTTPLSIAARRGHLDILQLLLSRNDIDMMRRDSFGRTAFSWAKNEETKRLFIDAAEKRNLRLETNDFPPREEDSWENPCDICKLALRAASYVCGTDQCHIEFCSDCKDLGAVCPVKNERCQLRLVEHG